MEPLYTPDVGVSTVFLFQGESLLPQEMWGFQLSGLRGQWRLVWLHYVTLYLTFIIINVFFMLLKQTQIISDNVWKLVDGIWDRRVNEIRAEASMQIKEDKEEPQLLMASHFL